MPNGVWLDRLGITGITRAVVVLRPVLCRMNAPLSRKMFASGRSSFGAAGRGIGGSSWERERVRERRRDWDRARARARARAWDGDRDGERDRRGHGMGIGIG